MLEQLLKLLQNSQEGQESLEDENMRLKRENAELKDKLRAIKSTIGIKARDSAIPEELEIFHPSSVTNRDKRPTSSDVYSTPLN